MECSNLNETSTAYPHIRLREHCEKWGENCIRIWAIVLLKSVLGYDKALPSHVLKAVVVTFIRPAQDQTSQHSSMGNVVV